MTADGPAGGRADHRITHPTVRPPGPGGPSTPSYSRAPASSDLPEGAIDKAENHFTPGLCSGRLPTRFQPFGPDQVSVSHTKPWFAYDKRARRGAGRFLERQAWSIPLGWLQL